MIIITYNNIIGCGYNNNVCILFSLIKKKTKVEKITRELACKNLSWLNNKLWIFFTIPAIKNTLMNKAQSPKTRKNNYYFYNCIVNVLYMISFKSSSSA